MSVQALPPAPPGAPSALPLEPGHATAVSARVSMLRDDDRFVYFLNTDPVCAHAVDDKRGRNLCLGRFALFGLATQSELARAHGISQSTVSRARRRLEQRGESGFVGPRKERRRHGIEDPELLARAARMLEAGRSVYGVAKELGVSSSTLWRYTREGRLPASQCPARRAGGVPEPGGPASPGPAGEPAGRAVAEAVAEAAAGPAAESVAKPAPEAAERSGGRSAAGPAGESASAVSGGGVLAALPALLRAGLLRRSSLLALPKGCYGLPSLLLLWAFLLLARLRNPERLGYRDPGEWGAVLGLDRCPCPRTLRRRTRQLAACEGLRAWSGQLVQEWCADAPDTVATLFVDGHVQTYSGKGNLPKHFVPRLKLALPAAAAYWVHALGGAPLLCLHRQVDDGMVREIWQRIVPQLQALGLLPDDPDPESDPVLTLVFDREGWCPQLFHELRAKGIAVVTWIKGPQEERWPASEFEPATIPVRAPGGPGALEGRVAERPLELEFGRNKTVLEAREIRFQADRRLRGTGQGGKERQPSILTTHPQLPAQRVAGLLRSRWVQENYFEYMRSEFGLDTLPEHALVDVDEDAWVVNPAWRAIEKALKKERNSAGHLRRKRVLEADADADRARALDARIQASEQAVEGLLRVRKRTTEHVRAGELTAKQRLQALPAPLRALTDTLRMIAYRAETAMAAAVAPEPGHPDTVRSLLKALFQTDASLLPDPAAGTLTVRLLHQATRARDAALAPLLDELNQTRTVFPGTSLRLVYEILPAGPAPSPRPPPLSADNLCNLDEAV